MSRRRIVGSLLVLMAAGSSAACSGGTPTATGPAVVSPTVAAATAAMAGRPATMVATPAGTTLQAPLFTVARPDGGGVFVATLVSVGGGPVIPVQVDTGSSGLVVDATAVGADTQRNADQPETRAYLSGSYTGTAGRATVAIGPASTPPVGLMLADLPVGTTAFGGTRGILGVGTANGAEINTSQPAPQLALPAPLDAGQSFSVAPQGLGTWTLGPVSSPAGAQVLPLTPATSAAGSPPTAGTGQTWAKDVTMCWTVGARPSACGLTDLDLGATDTAFNATTDAALDGGGGTIAAGQPVTATGAQGQPVWSFTTGQATSQNRVKVENLGPSSGTRFNSGIAFFLGRTVAWDYAHGRLVLGN